MLLLIENILSASYAPQRASGVYLKCARVDWTTRLTRTFNVYITHNATHVHELIDGSEREPSDVLLSHDLVDAARRLYNLTGAK